MATKNVTVIAMETDRHGYPDPLFYEFEIPEGTTDDEIIEMTTMCRVEELSTDTDDPELEQTVRDTFRVLMAWEGTFHYDDVVFDHRI